MHARGYETISTCIHSGAIILSKLGVLLGRHALDIKAVGLVTGLLDRLPNRGKYKKVIRCDIYTGTSKHTTGGRKLHIQEHVDTLDTHRRLDGI